MRCPDCGYDNPEGRRYCEECGQKLASVEAEKARARRRTQREAARYRRDAEKEGLDAEEAERRRRRSRRRTSPWIGLLLLAVIEKRMAVHIGGADVYLSVAGGLDVRERGADLGIVISILSSLRNRAVAPKTTAVAEVGLSGEARSVRRLAERVGEAAKLGYERILVPEGARAVGVEGIRVVPIESIDAAVAELGLG